ncbi:acetate/propionate family kinase [Amycolatopsis sp. WGS_07]|uniref:acetate/propionate family kinase n=1 Tax=Amycolatopsis sp. WGS_07 TaxID=3076764 RepID=UPI003872AF61
MNVLTVNPGSGSLRMHLVRTEDEKILDSTSVSSVDCLPPVSVVAHRLVHGGPDLIHPARVTPAVRAKIAEARSLAPEHVPKTEALLDQLTELLPSATHVVCPDTAFHHTLPSVAQTYPLPARWRSQWDLRRYGFHGWSFSWATRRAAELLHRSPRELNLLIAHLSGGCSVCAVSHGRSVDTSMGFTPLEGAMMTKRSGSVDPGMLLWLLREGKLTVSELEDGLYHHSGLLGLSGTSDDTRDLVRDGSVEARFALAVFEHRIRRELAAAATSLPRIDALVFTGDIGWDQPETAEAVADGLGVLGIAGGLSRTRERDSVISPPGAEVPVLSLRSREELELARASVDVAR